MSNFFNLFFPSTGINHVTFLTEWIVSSITAFHSPSKIHKLFIVPDLQKAILSHITKIGCKRFKRWRLVNLT